MPLGCPDCGTTRPSLESTMEESGPIACSGCGRILSVTDLVELVDESGVENDITMIGVGGLGNRDRSEDLVEDDPWPDEEDDAPGAGNSSFKQSAITLIKENLQREMDEVADDPTIRVRNEKPPRTPVEAKGIAQAEGECTWCGAHNSIDDDECQTCGDPLYLPCPGCEEEVAVWEASCPLCELLLRGRFGFESDADQALHLLERARTDEERTPRQRIFLITEARRLLKAYLAEFPDDEEILEERRISREDLFETLPLAAMQAEEERADEEALHHWLQYKLMGPEDAQAVEGHMRAINDRRDELRGAVNNLLASWLIDEAWAAAQDAVSRFPEDKGLQQLSEKVFAIRRDAEDLAERAQRALEKKQFRTLMGTVRQLEELGVPKEVWADWEATARAAIDEAVDAVNAGDKAMAAGDLTRASEHYKQATELAQDTTGAFRGLTRIREEEGMARGLYTRADEAYRAQRYGQAVDLLEEALLKQPGWPAARALRKRASARYQQVRAIQRRRNLVILTVVGAVVVVVAGIIFYVRFRASQVDDYLAKARNDAHSGRWAEALAAVNEALAIEPEHPEATSLHAQLKAWLADPYSSHLQLARQRLMEGDTVAALQEATLALAESAQPEAYLLRRQILVARQEWDRADADLSDIIQLDAGLAAKPYFLGRCGAMAGEPNALQFLWDAWEMGRRTPDGVVILAFMAWLEDGLSNQDEAVLASFPNPAEAPATPAWLEARQGVQILLDLDGRTPRNTQERASEAIDRFSRAIEAAPATPELYVMRSAARRLATDLRGAREDLDLALRLHPRLRWAYYLRASLPGGVGQVKEDLQRARERSSGLLKGLVEAEVMRRAGNRAHSLTRLVELLQHHRSPLILRQLGRALQGLGSGLPRS